MIDLFPSKQAGIAGMAVSFSIARGIAWPEGRSDKKKVTPKNSLTFGAEEVYANGSSQLKVVMNTTILSYYMLMGARRNVGNEPIY